MTHPACSILPSYIVEKIIMPPYREAENQFQYAFFQNKNGDESVESPSLIGRVTHLVTGVILCIPIVNWVVYVAMQYFNLTLEGRLRSAVESGDLEAVEFYLNLQFSPNTEDSYGVPLVYRAAEVGSNGIVKALLERGADPNATFEGTPLIHLLAKKEEFELAKEVITQYRADDTKLNADGQTILQVLYDADTEEKTQFWTFITDGVVNPNVKDQHGDTIVHHVLKGGDVDGMTDMISRLAGVDVDVNIRSGSTGKTPLWMVYEAFNRAGYAGTQGAIAMMNLGANPNEAGDSNEGAPGTTNIFNVANDLGDVLCWMTALKHGARPPEGFADTDGINGIIVGIDGSLKEAYSLTDTADEEDVLKARLTLLKKMDDSGWGTFSFIFNIDNRDLWIPLLEMGVKPGEHMDRSAIMQRILRDDNLERAPERRQKILLTMQEEGWDLISEAHQLRLNDDVIMLLENGAKPPAQENLQQALIGIAMASPKRKEIAMSMSGAGWNFEPFAQQVARDRNYAGVRFAMELGVHLPEFTWETARDNADFRRHVACPDHPERIPTGYMGEAEFLIQLTRNINDPNERLEALLFLHSHEGVKRMMRESTFEQFSDRLNAVMSKYPCMNVMWIWENILTIPQSHFDNYRAALAAEDELPELPYRVAPNTMLDFFNRINFTNPGDNATYKNPNTSCIDEGNNIGKDGVRGGLASLIRKISHRSWDHTVPRDPVEAAAFFDDHQKHLEAVAFFIQLQWDENGKPIPDPQNPGQFLREDPHSTAPLNSTKANILIDMGKAGTHCSARWKDTLYESLCRASGKEQKALNFVEQMRKVWADERRIIAQAIADGSGRESGGALDNLMFHIRDERAIPGDKPMNLTPGWAAFSNPGDRGTVRNRFDERYTTARMIEVLRDHMLQKNDTGNDFRELMQDWMRDNLAQVATFTCADGKALPELRREAREMGYDDRRRIPFAVLNAFMKQYQADYEQKPTGFPSLKAFIERLNRDDFLTPFANILQMPPLRDLEATQQVPLQQAKQRYHNLLNKCLPERDRPAFNQLFERVQEAERAFADGEAELLDLLSQKKDNGYDLRTYLILKKNEIRNEKDEAQYQQFLGSITGLKESAARRNTQKDLYNARIGLIRQTITALKTPQAVLQFFWPGGDYAEVQRILRDTSAADDVQARLDDANEAITRAIQGQDVIRQEYEGLLQAEEWVTIDDEEEVRLAAIREQFYPGYAALKKELEVAEKVPEQQAKVYLAPYYEALGVNGVINDPPLPRQDGTRFNLDILAPLGRAVSDLEKGGGLSQGRMQEILVENAEGIHVVQDMTLRDFMATPEFGAFSGDLGEAFMDGAQFNEHHLGVLLDRNLSDPDVKAAIARLYGHVAFEVIPYPFSYYLTAFQRDKFTPHMHPLRDGSKDVFAGTKGFSPLTLIQMLVELGELRYTDDRIFTGAFEPLPEPVQEGIATGGMGEVPLGTGAGNKGAAFPGRPAAPGPSGNVDWTNLAKGAAAVLALYIIYKRYLRPHSGKMTEWWDARRAIRNGVREVSTMPPEVVQTVIEGVTNTTTEVARSSLQSVGA